MKRAPGTSSRACGAAPAAPIVGPARHATQPGDERAGSASALLEAMRDSMSGLFTITASGETMQEAGLAHGDVLLLQATTRMQAGELLAIRLNGSSRILLRRARLEEDGVWLQAEDPAQGPVRAQRAAVSVVGRVVAIARMAPGCAIAFEASAA